MTIEEVEDVVRALTAVMENLETSAANNQCRRHSFRCAPMPLKYRRPPEEYRLGNDRLKLDLFRLMLWTHLARVVPNEC
jgi:hypothetical protein